MSYSFVSTTFAIALLWMLLQQRLVGQREIAGGTRAVHRMGTRLVQGLRTSDHLRPPRGACRVNPPSPPLETNVGENKPGTEYKTKIKHCKNRYCSKLSTQLLHYFRTPMRRFLAHLQMLQPCRGW